ncbi:hypothetical protein ANN_22761 [Periplaneta americana]|uniref:Uncharacterized protein n=1 Tax=Periplaneta americana TaxID=6978 RepID=A0ABQ8SJN7_PERAM|nr:hypothetical protein ANN_22761 [Periplaneta americana]
MEKGRNATILKDYKELEAQIQGIIINAPLNLLQKTVDSITLRKLEATDRELNTISGLCEWRDGIKMVGNVAAVRAVPGRSQDNRCRHCHNEVETLAHVLGSCPHGEGLRNARHHQLRSIIATALKHADYNTFEEVHGLSVTGSTRRIDIIAFKESTRSGFIIDPTVRFETDEEQPAEVDKEKKNIYNPTIPYYLQKYQLEELEVIGLLVGARDDEDEDEDEDKGEDDENEEKVEEEYENDKDGNDEEEEEEEEIKIYKDGNNADGNDEDVDGHEDEDEDDEEEDKNEDDKDEDQWTNFKEEKDDDEGEEEDDEDEYENEDKDEDDENEEKDEEEYEDDKD